MSKAPQEDARSTRNEALSAELKTFVERSGPPETVDILFPDINGVLRGKQGPASVLEKLAAGHFKMPRSVYCVDIFNRDVDAAALAEPIGDPDGLCRPVAGTLAPVPWAGEGRAQIMVMITGEDSETPFFCDPRGVLAGVVRRFHERGLRPVAATELEFYLIDKKSTRAGAPRPPRAPMTGERAEGAQIQSMERLSAFAPILEEMRRACRIQGLPVETLLAEFGPGQFEINLGHLPDPLAAADHAVLMKRALRGVARAHGLDVSFMAKPYADHPGNGLHVHLSILDDVGRNIFAFAGATDTGESAQRGAVEGDGNDNNSNDNNGNAHDMGRANACLRHAIAGLQATAPLFQAVFAPHANSYRRFQPRSYAPVNLGWGMDHRGAAIRVPVSEGPAARLEHRIAGADANPYLVMAAVLAGVLHGLDEAHEPGPPIAGLAEPDGALSGHWDVALARFENSDLVGDYLGRAFKRVYGLTKRQEMATFATTISELEHRTYLRQV